MDILVCQSCGAFIRGRAKFCTGCGAYVTKFSPTSLPIVAQSSLPLVVALSPDPLVLEKALVEQKFQLYNGAHGGNGGNGSHDDNGGNGDYQSMSPEPASYGTSTPPIQSAPVQEPNFAAEAEASFASSQFSSIIGSAGTGKPTSRTADAQKIFDLLGQEPEPVIPEPEIPEPPPPEEYPEVPSSATPQVSIQPFHPGSPINDQDFAAEVQPAAPNSIAGIPAAQEPQPNAQVPPAIPAPQAQPPASVPSFSPMAPASPPGGFSAVPTAPTTQPSKTFELFDPDPVEPTSEAPKPAESAPNPFTKESFEPSPGIPMPPAWGSDTSSAESTNTTSKAVDSVISKDDSATQAQQVRGLLARRASNKAKHDLDDEPEPQAGKPAPWKMLTEPVEIAGRSVPKGALLVVGLVVLFLGFRLIGPVTGLIGGTFGDLIANQELQKLPSLSGTWQNQYQVNKATTSGKFVMEQKGTDIHGKGADPQTYIFSGKFQPPNIAFQKQYLTPDGVKDGKPVACAGQVKFTEDGRPTMTGTFTKQVGQGVFLTRRTVNLQGPFAAWMVKPAETTSTESAGTIDGISIDDIDIKSGTETIQGQQQFFLKIALGILVFCILLAMLSLKVFGPSGLLNIWGKKEFIPSQFKSQHNKMLKEMGKPIAKGGLPLGKRLDWNILQFDKPQNLALPPSMRESNPHILVMGAGQKGKTRLMANMITSDILSGDRAVVVIDSDGSLVDLVVNWIAAHPKGAKLAERVIIMDPTHKGGCPAYNPLEMPENGDMQGAASAVVFGFKAIYTEPPGSQSQWNQQTANIVRNSALLLMANGKTLTDMEKLLSSDNDFRDVLLEKIERQKNERVEYNTLLQQWDNYKRLARSDQWITWTEPIRNRIAATLSDPRIQPILTKAKGDLNLVDVVNQKKVLLVKVPQSAFDDNANLLGSLIVTGLKQATLSGLPGKSAKRPSVLYLDEFDNFIEKDTIDTITSETKTFQIGLIGACKTLQHLPEDSRNQLAIHMGTICAFSLAKKDADMLGPQMFRVDGRKIKHQTIQNVFNKVNTTPQFELISDEEKLNIDRVVGQEERTFFCYKVGTVAGVFHLKAPDFKDVPEKDINWALVEQMYGKA